MWIIANTESSGPAPRGAICYHQHLFLQKPLHTVIEDKDSTSQGGPPSMSSSTLVVAIARDTDNTPQGPTIDVFFNFDGGCGRRYRQHSQGGRH
jgi:hypothetical protein